LTGPACDIFAEELGDDVGFGVASGERLEMIVQHFDLALGGRAQGTMAALDTDAGHVQA
jgi:hypothetical protein